MLAKKSVMDLMSFWKKFRDSSFCGSFGVTEPAAITVPQAWQTLSPVYGFEIFIKGAAVDLRKGNKLRDLDFGKGLFPQELIQRLDQPIPGRRGFQLIHGTFSLL